METFRSDEVVLPEHHRRFRVVPANVYLREFASDRHHMKREDGTWIKTPPDYPPISTPSTFNELANPFIPIARLRGCLRGHL